MKTREKSYADYGFEEGEARLLMNRCKSLDDGEKAILRDCAFRANEAEGQAIFYSLTHGLSFEKVSMKIYPQYRKPDFYGYRRLCLALFREALMKNGGIS